MKNKALFMAFFLAISITNLVSAATWWDSTDVRRTEDGCIEYSLKVEEAINKNNGDIFSGVVVQKFGHFRPCTYSSNTNKVSKSHFDHRQNKVVALKGIINGKNISNISLYKDVHVKYIAHRNDKRCKSNHIYNGEKTKVDERYHPIVKKNGVEIAKICKCPIEIVVEREPVLTAENKLILLSLMKQ